MYMQSWIRNERGDITDFLIGTTFIIAVMVFIFAMISAGENYTRRYEQAPCSEFANYSSKNIPARCVEYFAHPKEATETAK